MGEWGGYLTLLGNFKASKLQLMYGLVHYSVGFGYLGPRKGVKLKEFLFKYIVQCMVKCICTTFKYYQ